MNLLSKPCAREGCTKLVTAAKPHLLRKRKYCSNACQVIAKKAAGWTPHAALNFENRRRGGLASGKRTHALQRRRRLHTAVRECLNLIPTDLKHELSARGLALMRVLLGRAFERGRRWEQKRLGEQRRRDEQKGAAA